MITKFISIIMLTLACYAVCSQPARGQQAEGEQRRKVKINLLSEIMTLEADAEKLTAPLARARAQAELADPLWVLDEAHAKQLLESAFELTLPTGDERKEARGKPIGAALKLPSRDEVARNLVRRRVIEVASRDGEFLSPLLTTLSRELGREEEHYEYADLAKQAINSGDLKAARDYIERSMDADPTLLNAPALINDVAARDRAAADAMIVQYLAKLDASAGHLTPDTLARTFFLLNRLMFEQNSPILSHINGNFTEDVRRVSPPGATAMRAYAIYVLNTLNRLEQSQPGTVMRMRFILTSASQAVRQHAPELTDAFARLERLSYGTGTHASSSELTRKSAREEDYRRRIERSSNEKDVDTVTIDIAINRGDFDKARDLIGNLSDEPMKKRLTETVNAREAVHHIRKGELGRAERLAQSLSRVQTINQVFLEMIKRCVANKDEVCAETYTRYAIEKLKRADTSRLPILVPGVPTSDANDARILVISGLGSLAEAVAPLNILLACDVLDELVLTANQMGLETDRGQVGIDGRTFKTLASLNAERAEQSARNLKDGLQRVTGLAGVYRSKTAQLTNKNAQPKTPAHISAKEKVKRQNEKGVRAGQQ